MSVITIIDEKQAGISPLEQRATWLAYAGLIPFFATAFLMWLSPSVVSAAVVSVIVPWSMYYAAIILSFMGGVRWGLAMLDKKDVSDYTTIGQLTNSVIPALVAWMALIPGSLLPFGGPSILMRFILIFAAFIYLMEVDVRSARDGFAPRWYGPMRRKVTFFLAMAMILIMIRMFLWGW